MEWWSNGVVGWPFEMKRVAGQAIASADSVHRNLAEGHCRKIDPRIHPTPLHRAQFTRRSSTNQ
jgi:hypothetical protein